MKLYQKLGLLAGFSVLGYQAQAQGSEATEYNASMNVAKETSAAIASGQFSEDKHLDYIMAATKPGTEKAYIRVYAGDGTGKFPVYSKKIGYVACANETSPSITTGDFNKDGNTDFIITATQPGTEKSRSYLFLGSGTGSFFNK